MSVKVYWTSVSGSTELKKKQDRIFNVLDSKGVKYELIDISQNSADKDKMRKIAGKKNALAPQIVNGDTYCGDFEKFEEAVEMEKLEEFLNP